MHWTDEALVIGARPIGETGIVLETMTHAHGRHLGLVHGGRSRRLQPVLQVGNAVRLVWRARLDDQLGSFVVEPLVLRTASLIGSGLALAGAALLAGHLRFLPEREPFPALFEAAQVLADHLAEPAIAGELFVRFEIMLLAELGFGLDLARCAATGATDDLAFVSPRTGRAVSRAAGEPYGDRLLRLPPGILGPPKGSPLPASDVADGFALTGHFLDAHVYEPRGRGYRDERVRFLSLLTAARPVTAAAPIGRPAP